MNIFELRDTRSIYVVSLKLSVGDAKPDFHDCNGLNLNLDENCFTWHLAYIDTGLKHISDLIGKFFHFLGNVVESEELWAFQIKIPLQVG